MKEIISIIPARGGSKGIPKKNIINFLGKPLIYWTIKSSLECKFINRTIVSSDNDEIIKISKKCGAEVIFKRPKKLSLDNSKSLDAIKHCVEFLKKKEKYSPYAVVTLQPTSPFRNSKHLDQAIKKFLKFKNADSLVSVQELPHIYDPYSVMKKKNDLLEFIFKEKNKNETIRQKKKKYFVKNGAAIYITKTKKLNKYIVGGKIISYQMNKFESLDIDNFDDLKLGEIYFKFLKEINTN